MNKHTKFLIVVGLQILIIFFIIIFKLAVLTGGTEIVLRIEPVDPTSPLRGDYVTFQYSNISNLDSYITRGSQIRNGDTVYVMLSQSDNYWIANEIQTIKPANSDQLFLKGRVASGGFEKQSDFINNFGFSNSGIHVIYGIEEYFIPEGTGRNFSFFNKEAAAIVSVDDNGNAVLKEIVVDGKPWPN